MKKLLKNGFTLVELMAVLIILAIIVLLAINKLKGSMKKSNEKTMIANATVFVKAVNDGASTSRLTGNYEDGLYSVSDLFNQGLSLSGTKPTDGYVIISGGMVTSGCLKFDSEYTEIDDGEISYVSSCEITNIASSVDFEYTGSVQSFVAEKTGNYKLEVWGAQGGWNGGYGSYSVGTVKLSRGDRLAIVVGGQGTGDGTHTARTGGYNGGGNATSNNDSNTRQGSGGGATHIAKYSEDYTTLESYLDEGTAKRYVYIVAGGGGGKSNNNALWSGVAGGNAGGYLGNDGAPAKEGNTTYQGYGGTQTSGGNGTSVNGSFGKGASTIAVGGGGGWYGGGCGAYSGGGGSGYIGNTSLKNKSMYCYDCREINDAGIMTLSITCVSDEPQVNCAKTGNGYAKISYQF